MLTSEIKWLRKEIPLKILGLLGVLFAETINSSTEPDDPEDNVWMLERASQTESYSKIVDYSYQLLNSNGFSVAEIDYDDLVVECHEYNINGPHQPEFTMHTDDYGAIHDARVHTVIYYLQKDPTITGGDVLIYPNAQLDHNVPVENTDLTTCHRFEVNAGIMILMRGDLAHAVEEMGGTGIRRSVVVQIRRDLYVESEDE